MSIEFKEGAVCFTGGSQWVSEGAYLRNSLSVFFEVDEDSLMALMEHNDDFQLNEIRQGDYIEVSELDTKQKYDDAIAALCSSRYLDDGVEVAISYSEAVDSNNEHKRKLTYPQLVGICQLKRAMIELDEASPKDWHESQKEAKELECEWTDKHYNNFYQLTEEDIKSGQIKVDAYFVNRMWKINSWDDTGAGFHVLKTLPRIANNKNPLKRELMALKKQVDLLCKMHGVDDENTD